jgi:two-component system sensor histidine kinase YesM
MNLRQWLGNISIKRKFAVLFALITLPTLSVGFLTYRQADNLVRQQLESAVVNEMVSLAGNMAGKAEYYEFTVNQAVINEKFIYILSNEYNNLLNLVLDLQNYLDPHFITLKFLNRSISGVSVYHDHYIPEYGTFIINSDKVADRDWYQKSLTSLVCRWHFDGGAVRLTRKFPPFLMDGKSVVLVYEFDKERLIKEMVGSRTSTCGFVISNDQGTVIYESRLPGISYTGEALSDGRGQLKGLIGQSMLLEPLGLRLTVYTWNRTATTALSIFSITAVLLLLTMILIGATLVFMDRLIIRPLVALDKSMGEVSKGNYTSRISSSNQDEIGRICQQFDKMVKDVDRLIKAVVSAQNEKTRAELTALRTQINPHFLYNSLSAITWKAMFTNNKEIHEIATSLAAFYRTVLNRGNTLIEVENEIENIRAYVRIQRILRENGFTVRWKIQSEVLKTFVLCFILQPLVENAIVHGIDARTGGRGLLIVSAFRDGDLLVLRIEDNGAGMRDPQDEKKRSTGSGYGIRNVNERIRLYYGSQYGIRYQARQAEGTMAEIKLPIISQADTALQDQAGT